MQKTETQRRRDKKAEKTFCTSENFLKILCENCLVKYKIPNLKLSTVFWEN